MEFIERHKKRNRWITSALAPACICMFVFRYTIYELEFDNCTCMTNDFVQNAEITKQI
jgi:hypothetical protein